MILSLSVCAGTPYHCDASTTLLEPPWTSPTAPIISSWQYRLFLVLRDIVYKIIHWNEFVFSNDILLTSDYSLNLVVDKSIDDNPHIWQITRNNIFLIWYTYNTSAVLPISTQKNAQTSTITDSWIHCQKNMCATNRNIADNP